ncbi:hypothetical protein D16iCDA_00045 [Pseudomonas seleniipraecipitans]|uniref:Uncharacterized protein n=1 Tax=Phytopseudomonas seleniipraecipitans TaxID=640205 RepID=A0A1G7QHW9_9GAMM|nr:hypothetical protein [Pseudomonas seleniipraecipitans]UUD64147.1 hypothetical protein D16iCDA_00045 [Pseudomonas seleniipraecipitans]SDF98058.1 hypothetical protein SAMN05216381_2826 [Pseudomonas seleniipraecipitans]
MSTLQCTHRDHRISAEVMEHPGIPTPWAGGCRITAPDGRTTRRMALPVNGAFLDDLSKAQHASLAHGKWLVDQHLDKNRDLFPDHAAKHHAA